MAKTISEKITDILNVAPATFDPEDDVCEETRARVERQNGFDSGDDDDDLGASKFRKQNLELLEDVDSRYIGKKSSRKKLLDSNGWSSDDGLQDEGDSSNEDFNKGDEESDKEQGSGSDDMSQEYNSEDSSNENDQNNFKHRKDSDISHQSISKGLQDEGDSSNDDSNKGDDESHEEQGSSSDDLSEEYDNEDSSNENDQNFKHLKDSDTSHQISKGTCVRHQLKMWESLLEMRIQLQKCLLSSNKFPQTSSFNDIKEKCANQFTDKVSETKRSVNYLLSKLLELQLLLFSKYPETKTLLSGKNVPTKQEAESDEEIPSDTDDDQDIEGNEEDVDLQSPRKKLKIADFNEEISKRHKLYKDYRNSVIQKWNDKTRIAVSKSNDALHSIPNQIDHILSDKEKLVRRTQLQRTNYEIVGQQNSNEKLQDHTEEVYNTNIFDDNDFYHHLLRELIEFKSADLTDPVQLGRQWMQLQNLRSKLKRKIDTKATKGRKIRYAVHTKLVNFMAPIENSVNNVNDIYGSLFGKKQIVQ